MVVVVVACPAEWWVAGVVICLERGADLHMAKLMPLPLTVSFFSKIQIGFTFLVPAHPDSPAQSTVKRVCVCVCKFPGCLKQAWSVICSALFLIHTLQVSAIAN